MDLLVRATHGYARATNVKVVCERCWEELPMVDAPAALLPENVEDMLNDHIGEKHLTAFPWHKP